MQLGDLEKGKKFRIKKKEHYIGKPPENLFSSDGSVIKGEFVTYEEKDGMYCICSDHEGNKFNYPSWSNIIPIDD